MLNEINSVSNGVNVISVYTHSGMFHADEVLAIALLSVVFNTTDINVVRTRDASILADAKNAEGVWVLDVGGEYNPSKLCFDHHMREFDLVNSFGNKYSTFGLVVDHLNASGYFSDSVYEQISAFANLVDCQDNGIDKAPELFWIADMNALGCFDTVLAMATNWLKAKMVKWNQMELENKLIASVVSNVTGSGVAYCEDTFVPVDERINKYEHIKVVVYPSSSGGYSIQSLNAGVQKDFSMRCGSPIEWRGLRDAELCDVSGFEGMIFCHAGGFLTVVDTFEHAMVVAEHIVHVNKK